MSELDKRGAQEHASVNGNGQPSFWNQKHIDVRDFVTVRDETVATLSRFQVIAKPLLANMQKSATTEETLKSDDVTSTGMNLGE